MGMRLRVASFCSGIAAPETAWSSLGWEPIFFSEIEPFVCAVLAHHYPDVPNLGDMTKITDEKIKRCRPDVVCAGTPCQSFSVAGLRGGMADPRGNLALVFLGLVDRIRPRWVVWENVPGVLSSEGGRDFGSFLGGLGQLGYGWAYRVLDAQHFGVPQRRRRVFVVGYLGDWRRAAAVLFERHSLSGHPAPCRGEGERVAGTLKACAGKSGRPNGGEEADRLIVIPRPRDAVAIAVDEYNGDIGPVAATMAGGGRNNRIGSVMQPVAFAQNQRDEVRTMEVAGALAAEPEMKQQTYVIQERAVSEDLSCGPGGKGWQEGIAYTLESRHHAQSVATPMAVRRITPLEAERLQGFPDDYTAIQYRGKPAANGPRYRAIGNSMAVPVLRWIGERIAMVESKTKPKRQEANLWA
jgi:DNA (cytosine-5)-methyltransferase 1